MSIISNDLLGAYTSDDEENKSVSSMSGKSSIDPRVVASTAAFHARVRGSVPGPGGLKETQMFLPHPRVKLSIVGNLRDREVACSASDRQGSNFEFCVWRTVSSHSSHHPQEVLLAQFSIYVHKGGLKADSFHFYFDPKNDVPGKPITAISANENHGASSQKRTPITSSKVKESQQKNLHEISKKSREYSWIASFASN